MKVDKEDKLNQKVAIEFVTKIKDADAHKIS
jgi:hypothetical protein